MIPSACWLARIRPLVLFLSTFGLSALAAVLGLLVFRGRLPIPGPLPVFSVVCATCAGSFLITGLLLKSRHLVGGAALVFLMIPAISIALPQLLPAFIARWVFAHLQGLGAILPLIPVFLLSAEVSIGLRETPRQKFPARKTPP